MTSLKYSQASQSNQQSQFGSVTLNVFTRQLLDRLEQYDDKNQINLEQSIPILYDLNIFQELTSIPDAKRRLTQDSRPNHRLQLQAKFIYNLWKIVQKEFIPMKLFKSIITLFISEETSELASRLEQIFPKESDSIIQILAIWEGMLQSSEKIASNQEHKASTHNAVHQSSVLTEKSSKFNVSNQSSAMNRAFESNNNYQSKKYQAKQCLQERSQQTQKENVRYSTSKYTNSNTERNAYQTKRQNIEDIRNQIYNSQLYEIPALTVERQKELVNRLYVVNKYERYIELKKIQDQKKTQREMEQCTFRPRIEKDRIKRCQTAGKARISNTKSKTIPGFQKAIERMKTGQQKTKELREKLELRNITIKNTTAEQGTKILAPPKFLTRKAKKFQKKVLFTIQFDIGRHKLTCKIHQNQSAEHLARNIQSIYSLKEQSFQQIRQIIGKQIERYFELRQSQQQKQQENVRSDQKRQHNPQYKQDSSHFVFC